MTGLPDPAQLRWTAYLDAVESMIVECLRQLQAGEVPEPVPPALPADPAPAATEPRRARLAHALDELTERLTEVRDSVAAELRALPHRPPPGSPPAGSVGNRLDVLG